MCTRPDDAATLLNPEAVTILATPQTDPGNHATVDAAANTPSRNVAKSLRVSMLLKNAVKAFCKRQCDVRQQRKAALVQLFKRFEEEDLEDRGGFDGMGVVL